MPLLIYLGTALELFIAVFPNVELWMEFELQKSCKKNGHERVRHR